MWDRHLPTRSCAPRGTGMNVLAVCGLTVLALSACGGEGGAAGADGDEEETFPADGETLTLVVPWAPGGGVDSAARAAAPILAEELGIDVVVENIEGAGGRIGAQNVYDATDDYYRIVTGVTPSHSLGEIVFNAGFNALDFEPIYGFAQEQSSVMVADDSPYESFTDLIEASKEQRLLHGNPGAGGAASLTSAILNDATALEFEEVPHQGTSEVVAALMSGDVDFMVNVDINLSLFEEIRSIGAMAPERSEFAPDVPTLAEQGQSDVPALLITRGWWASPGTPEHVLDTLEAAFADVYESDEWKDFADAQGLPVVPLSRQEMIEVDQESHRLVEEYGHLMSVD